MTAGGGREGAFRTAPAHFAPRDLHFAARRWNRDRAPPRLGPFQPLPAAPMDLLATIGTSLPMALLAFGVLLFSVTTAVVALLADY